ncbi:MAG: hypothetical protein DI539_24015 [Flavobacterium psychrophilum]|jgi:hypothetical protein|nr:MAG: hypothetical protein DI539_24015 [Flavobacterium psychrophilum]
MTIKEIIKLKKMEIAQIGMILFFSILPLFIILPFKINLFLAWEGAYRMSIGQVPFRDFYLPMGFGFWIIPALFFKIFGPFMSSLIKAQVFINLIGAFAFRSILKKLGVSPMNVFLSLLIYCISFVFVNFWPWYNHTVFIFELVAIHFLLEHIFSESNRRKIIQLMLGAFFLVLAVFTKQDGGALAVITGSVLLLYNFLVEKKVKWILLYAAFGVLFAALFVVPFLSHDFLYWFNWGRPPHNSRVNLSDILRDIFEGSEWIKFYLLAVVFVVIKNVNTEEDYLTNKKKFLFALFTFSILIQAMLVQVTSYIPHNVNIYFHSIAFAFLISNVAFTFDKVKVWGFSLMVLMIMFWWSADYWRYGQRIIDRMVPGLFAQDGTRNQVSKYSWFKPDSTQVVARINWKKAPYKTFDNVLLPEGTIAGIDSLMKLEIIHKPGVKVLNMSELTPLEHELGFAPAVNEPMWYHRNVSIFDKEIGEYCDKITRQEYDVVLFEYIPNLNQFYPDEVRACLQKNYIKVNTFQAPRDNPTNVVEVYLRPKTE